MTKAGNNSSRPLTRPIGYWLKLVDKLLDEGINTIHSEMGINRTQWQLMHILSLEEETTVESLMHALRPFAGKEPLLIILEEMVVHNILEKQAGNFRLTSIGREVHLKCYEKQQAFRAQTMSGISGEDYNATLQTLQKIVENLSQ